MSAQRDDDERDERDEQGFLGRWSRLKIEARQPAAADEAHAPAKVGPNEPPPDLPPIEKLSLESDFSGFFHPKVDENLRRAALRKLFSDPHFNVMDGLDTYIDDYSKSEPIPAAMLAGLKQAQRIFAWAADKGEKADENGVAQSNDDGIEKQADAPPALEEPKADDPVQPVAEPDRVFSPKV